MNLRIWIKQKGFGWSEIPNGPFNITLEQISKARTLFADEWSKAELLTGAKNAPQTAARDILSQVAPQLTPFDMGILGFAVTAQIKNLRFEETIA
jgi:hypothetical protein